MMRTSCFEPSVRKPKCQGVVSSSGRTSVAEPASPKSRAVERSFGEVQRDCVSPSSRSTGAARERAMRPASHSP